jgi:hypothetical protein
MDPATLNRWLGEQLEAFAWEEWAQMGISAHPQRKSPWAQDPEALILFTLEVARGEPRLFDELLDWMLVNEPLLSVRRLRALCVDDTDRVLLEGALGWLATQRPRARLAGASRVPGPALLEHLFRPAGPSSMNDESFAAVGLARPPVRPSGKSSVPDGRLPINLSFRLRQILGVGIRSETIRILLGTGAPWVSAQTLARASGFSKRNVHEALSGLAAAEVIEAVTVGSVQRYIADRDAWAALLHTDPAMLPEHRDWPQLLGALRRILRFTGHAQHAQLSNYLLGSRTRELLEEIRGDLAFAGIPVSVSTAERAWPTLTELVENILAALETQSS